MRQGLHIAQAGHPIPLYNGDATGGHTSQYFSMKGCNHVSILICFGAALAAAPTSIQLFQATDINGTNAQAMPFNVFAAEVTNSGVPGAIAGQILDSLSPRIAVLSTGYVPAASYPGSWYVIELDGAEMSQDYGLTNYPVTDLDFAYLAVQVNAGAHATPTVIIPILSALAFEGESQPTQLT